MKSGIYKITAPDGKIYVGQSSNIANRWGNYRRLQSINFLLQNSFDNLGFDKHTFEIAEYCSTNQLNERERYYQDLYDACGDMGLNCLLVKTEDKPQVLRQEFKNRIKQAFKNKPNGHFSGNQMTVLNTETGIFYDSVKHAAFSLGISQAGLCKSLNGVYVKHRYPIVYAFPDKKRDELINARQINNSIPKKRAKREINFTKIVYDTVSGVYYNSLTEAAKTYNMKLTTLLAMLKGQNKNRTNLAYA